MRILWSRLFRRTRNVSIEPHTLISLPDIIDNVPSVDERRIMKLEGGVNFRDIGGYLTEDGYRVRWGKVYRSGLLSRLTPHDLDVIARLNIRLICDLRGPQEVRSAPEALFDLQREHIPIEAPDGTMDRLYALFFDRQRLTKILVQAYTETMIKENPHVFGVIFRHLADPDHLPILIRCTAGKDRTGIVIAILLLALGVPDDTVLADYSLSNYYYEDFKVFAQQAMGLVSSFGLLGESLQPLMLADPALLRQTIAYVRSEYGSVDAYLRNQAGIDADTLADLRRNLLEPLN